MVSSVYFNPARSPITVTLRTGEVTLVPPKGRLEVTVAQDRSPSLLGFVRKGLLKKIAVPIVSEPVAVVPPVEVGADKAISPVDVPVVPVKEPAPEKPSMLWTRSKLLQYAQKAGLEIDTKSSKAEVLRAIQGAGL